jgi:hypothetical protein
MGASKLNDQGGTAVSGSYMPDGHSRSSLNSGPGRTVSGAGEKTSKPKPTTASGGRSATAREQGAKR